MGLPRAVDPGHHVVAAKLAGKTSQGEGSQEIDVREGEQKPVEVVLTVAAIPEQVEGPPAAPEPEAPPPTTKSHSPTILTWAGIGLAGAGVITGTVTGLMSMSKKSALQGECANDVCGPSSYSDYDAANTYATISTIGFIAAGVGAGVALVSLIVGHEEPSAAPAMPPQGETGLVVRPWIGVGAGGVSGSF
jgi:hypothetical protein